MKLGVSMWSYVHAWKAGKIDIPGFVHEAKRIGADGVELLDFFYKDREKEPALIQKALEETGLPVATFSVAQNFAKPDPLDRKAELGKIEFGVNEAVRYGAKVVRVFAGDVAADSPINFDDARNWIVEGLAEASVYAESNGIKLALENHGKLAGRSDQVKGIIEDVRVRSGVQALGANPDTGNFLLVGQPSHEAIRDVAKYANMVHFKDFTPAPEGFDGFAYGALDGSKFIGTAIGEGSVNLAECVAALKSAGFEGWLNVEYEAEEDPFTGVTRSIENARKFI
ncbi:MAG: sugar phosphate isomerase/epimerase [Armatimonadetes bacterium]|nr:sugar phosphate isomerase/epimerase [Armatimonadota bacterium]